MTRGDDEWWRADVDAATGRPLRVRARRRSRRCCPILARRASPTACTNARSCGGRRPSAWTDAGWDGRSIEGGVIYELHIGTFTPAGTFDSAIEKLDYLVDLGVDFVELMPVNAFGGTHGWGYDGVLWYAVHEPYGGPDGLVRLIDACHARGLGVLIDAVFNHLGPSGNYLPRFGPYLSTGQQPVGRVDQHRRRRRRRGAPLHHRLRTALDARLPRRRPATRRRARAGRHHRLSTSSRSSPPKPTRWQQNWAGRCR